LIGNPAR